MPNAMSVWPNVISFLRGIQKQDTQFREHLQARSDWESDICNIASLVPTQHLQLCDKVLHEMYESAPEPDRHYERGKFVVDAVREVRRRLY